MWFDGIAEQEARAKFRAITALVAGGFADGGLMFRGLELALDGVMRAGQDDDARRSFGYGRFQIVGIRAHHQPADADDGISRVQAAGSFDTVTETGADRHADGAG